ncbi:MAG: hypothetical protein A2511_14490 [Deltaproteobacteria bacterium RIFOXYD12_FULL_50_9]|nr:MAG: hypothetical protein A2511_14490 [Deltaproteobacteria bacterium RIFOXYD12_FULL_50_9]
MNHFSWSGKFGFNKNPFHDTLDVGMFFRTKQHEEALVKVRIGIKDGHALILLVGISGTGKTMVSQVAIRTMDLDVCQPVFVFVYPGMGRLALLSSIFQDLEPGPIKKHNFHSLLEQVQDRALALHGQGKRLVVVIDEAHFLKADALHILRTLSNLETEQEKLVTVLLVAEKSLLKRLKTPSYAALRGRITFAIELKPLTLAETEQYVKFRLLKAGASPRLLTSDTYETLHFLSKGIPREINRLLYNGFMEAMALDGMSLTPEILKLANTKMVLACGNG